jgi:hypothetical protein
MNMVSSSFIPKSKKKKKKKPSSTIRGGKKSKEKESNDHMKMTYEIRKCTRTSSATIDLAHRAPLPKIKT